MEQNLQKVLFSNSAEVSAVSTGSITMQTITGIIMGITMGCSISASVGW